MPAYVTRTEWAEAMKEIRKEIKAAKMSGPKGDKGDPGPPGPPGPPGKDADVLTTASATVLPGA